MITDRANASFVINDNKICGFFGYCYKNNNYANSIEYIDYDKLDKWEEIKKEDLNFDSGDDIKNDIRFDIESVGSGEIFINTVFFYRQEGLMYLVHLVFEHVVAKVFAMGDGTGRKVGLVT